MPQQVLRSYRLKFYLNAQHYIMIGGRRGETHPHTWEFTLTIGVASHEFTPFSVFEDRVKEALAPYQNQVLNEVEPFDTVMPTLESLVEEFAQTLAPIIDKAGGSLVALEGSEGPTRSYCVRLGAADARNQLERDEQVERSRVIDDIVGEMLE